ncbi:MAG: hypothetical protein KIS73_07480 [Enhydrobacter sp.]|nr:hypothetical protein [Enhydrobacter sp.]
MPPMNAASMRGSQRVVHLDYDFLQRLFMILGLLALGFSPLARDPVAFCVGAILPYILLRIINCPGMPVAVVYLVIWQWAQTFARVLQTFPDGEALGAGLFGPNVERAYWYMLASVLVLALCMRLTLGRLPPPTAKDRLAHAHWQPRDLVVLYFGTLVLSVLVRFSGIATGALEQPISALLYVKTLVLFLLFANVLTTKQGGNYALVAILIETITGFTGILSDFKAVFIFLALAAVAVRIRWTFAMGMGAVVWGVVLISLALFWTSVKMEYRQIATGTDDSQAVTASLGDRLGYLGSRALSPGEIDWNKASYLLLVRFAYVDIFGSVITVQEASREGAFMRQWADGLSHVLQPRFLFPNKAPLSDSEVYVRLAKGDPTEEVRAGTSISVGYMAENFVDLGFPGMLFGIAAIGLAVGTVYRFFMTRKIPVMVREGTLLVLVYSIGRDGVEISLPKILGAFIMSTIVYLMLVKFAYPRVLAWLDRPPGGRTTAMRGPRASATRAA